MDLPSMNHIAGGDWLPPATFPVQPITDGWMGSNSLFAELAVLRRIQETRKHQQWRKSTWVMINEAQYDEEGNENAPDDSAFNLSLS